MRLWSFRHFFLLSAKCFPKVSGSLRDFLTFFEQRGDYVKTLPCSANDPEASTGWGETKWKKDFIYPVEVCLKSYGDVRPVHNCSLTSQSRFLVTIDNPTTGESTDVQHIPIDVDKFNADHEYCHVIDASVMAMALRLQGRDVTGTRMKATAKLCGGVMEFFNVEVGVMPYYPYTHGLYKPLEDHYNKLVAVVCNHPGCIITAGSVNATKTENFRIKENEAPQYEPNLGPLTEDMFSITYFDSNFPGAFNVSYPDPSNALYQLTEALVMTA